MTLKKLTDFFDAERKQVGKSKSFMARIYKNRAEQDLERKNHIAVFLFDRIGELHFKNKATKENVDKITYGFEQWFGKKVLWDGLSTYLSFRTTEIKEIKAKSA